MDPVAAHFMKMSHFGKVLVKFLYKRLILKLKREAFRICEFGINFTQRSSHIKKKKRDLKETRDSLS